MIDQQSGNDILYVVDNSAIIDEDFIFTTDNMVVGEDGEEYLVLTTVPDGEIDIGADQIEPNSFLVQPSSDVILNDEGCVVESNENNLVYRYINMDEIGANTDEVEDYYEEEEEEAYEEDEDYDESLYIEYYPEERDVQCRMCGKMFITNKKLMSHYTRLHKKKKLRCQYCSKLFHQKKDLKMHERVHTDARPYKCEHPGCGKSFKQKCTLDTHMVTHTREKKQQCCHVCGKRYSHKKSLALHIKEKHMEATRHYQCLQCHKIFEQYTKFKYHQTICCKPKIAKKVGRPPKTVVWNPSPAIHRHQLI